MTGGGTGGRARAAARALLHGEDRVSKPAFLITIDHRNSPPLDVTASDDDARDATYLIDYPAPVIGKKVRFMTGLLEDTFGVKMRSHRAGRWAMDERYARALADCGYTVDCSVTPGLSWRRHAGAPGKPGGSDYRRFRGAPTSSTSTTLPAPATRSCSRCR